MRIAVLVKDRCHYKKCNHECERYCPRVRTGDETIVFGEDGRPIISEQLCVGCGICVNKCPFDAIHIIGIAEELKDDLVHQFGKNGFTLFRLPVPRKGVVTGILGPNGIGKTTSIKILSGDIIPNFGNYDEPPGWENTLKNYSGTELYPYFEKVSKGEIKSVIKPQYVDMLPKVIKGKIRALLEKADERGKLDEVVKKLELESVLDKNMEDGTVSGGELQRIAVAAALLRNVDVYFFDEPSSYLDIHQRLKVARMIRELAAEGKYVVAIEHDLAVLDFLCENIHLTYGSESVYGVVTLAKAERHAINTYLSGYLKEENIRFSEPLEFELHPPRATQVLRPIISFGKLKKKLGIFTLDATGGTIHEGESIGVVGANATGKTTFMKMLAKVLEPDEGTIDSDVKIAYKPQYIKSDFDGSVETLIYAKAPNLISSAFLKEEVFNALNIKMLMETEVCELSGGELQRVAIALCLAQDADVYLLDEPSAYLDSSQRMRAAKTIRRVTEKRGKATLIVDHDVYFIDMVSDSLMVFGGNPGKHGISRGPFDLRSGMNLFLQDVDITFRRDQETKRPRVNKTGSRLDREQRASGEYYYAAVE